MIDLMGSAAAAKVGYAAALGLAASFSMSGVALVAQVTGGATDTVSTLIPATALTATSGALVWVVKQIAGGNLVHRESAAAEAKLLDITQRLSAVAEKSVEREHTLTQLLISAHKSRGSDG